MRKIRTKNSNKRKLILNIFLFLFLLIGVGYSTVFTNLDINGDIVLLNYRDLNIKQTSSTDRTAFRSDTYRENIKTITLSDSISAPSNVIESWDISENGSGGVMAYVVQNTNDNTKYDLYIQGNGRLYSNIDASYLFSGLISLEKINGLDKLTTTKTTNMSNMFSGDSNITILDLSSFNMSKVTNTTDMLTGNNNLSRIKTPKVYPTSSTITLPKVLYDSIDTNYSTIGNTSPTETWIFAKYTATLDANGGNVGTSTMTVKYGEEYGSLPTPTKTGYVFAGWNGKNIFNSDVSQINPSSTNVGMSTQRTFTPNSYFIGLAFNNAYYKESITSTTINNNKILLTTSLGYGVGYSFILDHNKTYTLSYDVTVNEGDGVPLTAVMFYETDGTFLSYVRTNGDGNKNVTFSLPQSAYYTVLVFSSNNENVTLEFSNIQLEEGTSAIVYEPYYIKNTTNVVQNKDHTLKAKWIQKEYNYDSVGSYEFNTPINGIYKVELWGGSGYSTAYGGYVSGKINLTNNDTLYTFVGPKTDDTHTCDSTGFNVGTGSSCGWYGGGSTDIRLTNGEWNNTTSINSRIMIASGGGAGEDDAIPGAAGGLIGYDGSKVAYQTKYSIGGTQLPITYQGDYTNSYFGIANGGCTGGNGYWPANGAACSNGAGGGSSFISGHTGCVAIQSSTNQSPKTGCTTGTINNDCSIHYSNYKFNETSMIDGKGCKWTNQLTSDCSGQPQPNGTTTTGHSGNGYARITLISINN